jgi:hypothetical protein
MESKRVRLSFAISNVYLFLIIRGGATATFSATFGRFPTLLGLIVAASVASVASDGTKMLSFLFGST